MEERKTARRRLNILGIVVLVVGLVCAAFIYRAAGLQEEESRNAIGYEEGGQEAYPVLPEDSKSYQRSMELYGGKANLLADELRRRIDGLWHGTSLAYTVGLIAVLLAGALFGTANYLVPLCEGDDSDEDGCRETHEDR